MKLCEICTCVPKLGFTGKRPGLFVGTGLGTPASCSGRIGWLQQRLGGPQSRKIFTCLFTEESFPTPIVASNLKSVAKQLCDLG